MKILLITPEYPPIEGGVARYLESFVRSIPEHEVRVVTPPTWRRMWPRWIPAFWHSLALTRAYKPDRIVISHVLPFGYCALVSKLLFGTPYIAICHGLDLLAPSHSHWKKFWAQRVLVEAECIITNSNYTASLLRMYGIDPQQARVVEPIPRAFGAPDESRIHEIKKEFNLEGRKIIFSLGRLVTRKGIDVGIRAFGGIAAAHPELVYMIAGDGPDKGRLQKIAGEYGAQDRIIFLGFTSTDDLAALYKLCDIFILPTRESKADAEGFGTVFLEANAFEKPVIAGSGGGVTEAVLHGRSGLVVNPYDVQSVAHALNLLLHDSDLCRTLGVLGKERVEKNFTRERMRAALPL